MFSVLALFYLNMIMKQRTIIVIGNVTPLCDILKPFFAGRLNLCHLIETKKKKTTDKRTLNN